MPSRTIHCSRCGASISGYDFATRMVKLRRHYKEKHLGISRRVIKRKRRRK